MDTQSQSLHLAIDVIQTPSMAPFLTELVRALTELLSAIIRRLACQQGAQKVCKSNTIIYAYSYTSCAYTIQMCMLIVQLDIHSTNKWYYFHPKDEPYTKSLLQTLTMSFLGLKLDNLWSYLLLCFLPCTIMCSTTRSAYSHWRYCWVESQSSSSML